MTTHTKPAKPYLTVQRVVGALKACGYKPYTHTRRQRQDGYKVLDRSNIGYPGTIGVVWYSDDADIDAARAQIELTRRGFWCERINPGAFVVYGTKHVGDFDSL